MNEQGNTPSQPNWLLRQWERLRQARWRDVIIGQVGEGATNVVIGKNNVQINVSGRNLTMPIWLIMMALLVIVGFLVFPLVEPLWNPTQMRGQFRIAVAHFGELDSPNRVQATEKGAVLSKWFFDSLFREYNDAQVDVAQGIEIWHDDRADVDKNVTFGVIKGETPEARRQAAAKLADRIGAHMVIYGNLVAPGETGHDGQQLALEFYLSPRVNDETAAIVGAHRLGRPIDLPSVFDTGDPNANIAISRLLQVRADALFWLTVGLTQAILGRSAEALETFHQAEAALTNWRDEDGKEILYFFIGREALFLDQLDEAVANFERALALQPNYARAQIALGSALLKRAMATPPAERFAPPSDLEAALRAHEVGLALARQSGEPLMEQLAHLALAKSYRLYGETYAHLDDDSEARRYLALARQEVATVTAPLTAAGQYRLVAQAYEAEGAAYLQEADILFRQQQLDESKSMLDEAKVAYQNCIEQGRRVVADEVLTGQVIEQGCQRYAAVTEAYLDRLNANP
ncbi:MAG: hypothetical protein KJZ93_29165 [Caldilineaceae bacterium]|nr:hypothetical protein [Caldilineaceae bacterium]